MSEKLPSTDTFTNSPENAQLPEVFYTADHLDKCIYVQAEEVPGESFNVETNKQKNVVSSAEVLSRPSRQCSKRFLEEVLLSLHSSVLKFFYYINELLTSANAKKKLKFQFATS